MYNIDILFPKHEYSISDELQIVYTISNQKYVALQG